MNCNDCGAPLDQVTIRTNGLILCPQCGKTIHTQPEPNEVQHLSLQEDEERFEYIEQLGQGASGTVFKAYDKGLQRFVAIKIPRSETILKQSVALLNEARAASGLHHPNIVAIHDVIQLQSSIHIVSEYVDGVSLKYWLDQRKLDIENACRILIKICRAIAFAHEHGVIHRDIKPANIVMDKDDEPHLLDFGLSCSRQSVDSSNIGRPIGTPAFMSPEQVRGEIDKIDHHTDVYSAGVILYQMLSGHLPFSGFGEELYSRILTDSPTPLRRFNSAVAASLEAICLKAMAKMPSDRYANAKDLADDLENYLQGKAVSAYGKWDTRTFKHFARRRFLAGVAVTSAAGLAAVSWRSFVQPPSTVQPPTEPELKNVVIEVEGPPGKLFFQRLSESDGLLEANRQEVESGKYFQIRPGFYRVTYESSDEIFYVYREVPKKNVKPLEGSSGIELPHRSWLAQRKGIILPRLQIKQFSTVTKGMVYHAGGTLHPKQAFDLLKSQAFDIEPFLMDTHEVSEEQFRAVFPRFDYSENSVVGGAMVNVEFEHAVAFAEATGKQLQTAWQWLFACTNKGTTKFPWGDTVQNQLWPLEGDSQEFNNKSEPPVSRLYSSVLEWADTCPSKLSMPPGPFEIEPLKMRAIVGGPLEFATKKELKLATSNNPMWFAYEDSIKHYPNVGFRCVRVLKQKGLHK